MRTAGATRDDWRSRVPRGDRDFVGTTVAFIRGMANDATHQQPGPSGRRRVEPARHHLLDRTRAKIAERLRDVCADMPREEFQALVTRAAEIEIKYEVRQREVLLPTSQWPGRRRDQNDS